MKKIKVDFDLCESNAMCEALAPDHFQVDDDDFLQILDENVTDEDLRDRRAGRRLVPQVGDQHRRGLSRPQPHRPHPSSSRSPATPCPKTLIRPPSKAASPSSPAPVPGSVAPRPSPWPGPGPTSCSTTSRAPPRRPPRRSASHGVEALVVPGDVGERATADAMLQAAAEKLGRLDVVVNNAGITRDKMLFNMTDEDFDLVLKVHLRGHFLLSRNAAAYWRGRYKETGEPVDAAVVNTASEAFLAGSPGQAELRRGQGGITALTLSTARGLSRVGVRANAICPRARTAMTADVFGEDESGQAVDPYSRRPRRPARRLPRLAGRRADHRPGVRRVRRDGGPARRARRRAALRRHRRPLGPRLARPEPRELLRRPRPRGRLRRRLGDEPLQPRRTET